MNTRFLTILSLLAFLGLSIAVPAFAGKDKNCDPNIGDVHPSCGGGDGGDDHGDPPAQYCAELISGGFNFGTETVTRNNRGNEYNSPDGLHMLRSDSYSQAAWDAVFATCLVLSSRDGDITELTVSDKWAISNSGGKSAGTPDSPVLVSFKNAYNAEVYPDIEVDLHLRGLLPAEGFPTADSTHDAVEIVLDEFWFYVHAGGTDSCKILDFFDPLPSSVLRMTWGPCDP